MKRTRKDIKHIGDRLAVKVNQDNKSGIGHLDYTSLVELQVPTIKYIITEFEIRVFRRQEILSKNYK